MTTHRCAVRPAREVAGWTPQAFSPQPPLPRVRRRRIKTSTSGQIVFDHESMTLTRHMLIGA